MPGTRGLLIAGRYRLGETIGQGGMGRVWRAADEILDRQVAVKEMRINELDAEDSRIRRERTLREARATARIDHPNVVRVYDVVAEESDRLWIVMELVESRSLRQLLLEDGPVAPREAARIGVGLAAALVEVHAVGVLHRDIKPGNVLLGPGGRVVLTDFGIAAIQDAAALTVVGMLVGSPDYMAPERVCGQAAGPRVRRVVARRHPVRGGRRLLPVRPPFHPRHPARRALRGARTPGRGRPVGPSPRALLVKDPELRAVPGRDRRPPDADRRAPHRPRRGTGARAASAHPPVSATRRPGPATSPYAEEPPPPPRELARRPGPYRGAEPPPGAVGAQADPAHGRRRGGGRGRGPDRHDRRPARRERRRRRLRRGRRRRPWPAPRARPRRPAARLDGRDRLRLDHRPRAGPVPPRARPTSTTTRRAENKRSPPRTHSYAAAIS